MHESTALLTDQYELTMLGSALADGTAGRRSVFEVFARRLPGGRRYGVVAGIGRLLEALRRFRFDGEDLAFLLDHRIVDEPTARWLASYRFRGDIWGYAEGECYFPGSPILVVEGTFAEAVLLETLALSILNHDSAIAAAGSRMAVAAQGRPLIEMGSRRTHERAAIASARAAYVAGFGTTSNLAAGRAYGIPTGGTAAHAFTLLHDTEKDAFVSQIRSMGTGTTLLVDTYDIASAVRLAVEVAGPELGAVRIDSGDLGAVAVQVREELDALGATDTRIVVSGDLDEYAIAGLAASPVDSYGVGTSLVTGSRAPTCEFVYKLVARAAGDGPDAPLVGVAKRSTGKPTHKGRKWAFRQYDRALPAATPPAVDAEPAGLAEPAEFAEPAGLAEPAEPPAIATAEIVTTTPLDSAADMRALLVPLVRAGEIVGAEPIRAARARHVRSLAELPATARQLSKGDPALPTAYNGENR